MKNIFAHQGIPEVLLTDNGKQFVSSEFQKFAESWNFKHETSSPYFASGNGEAERAVQSAKRILSQPDPLLALLIYRDTPIAATGFSPAELASGRKLRTTLPTLPINLDPLSHDRSLVTARDEAVKETYKRCFDRHHGARPLEELRPGDTVLQKLDNEKIWGNPAIVQEQYAPRSYVVQTPSGKYRRNRRHLRPFKQPETPRPYPNPVQTIPPIRTTQNPASRHKMKDDHPCRGPTPTDDHPCRGPTPTSQGSYLTEPQQAACRGPTTTTAGSYFTEPQQVQASRPVSSQGPVPASPGSLQTKGAVPHSEGSACSPGATSSGPRPGQPSGRPPEANGSPEAQVRTSRSGRTIVTPARYRD